VSALLAELPDTLEAVDVTVAIGGRILVRNLNLALNPGQFTAVLGENGAGKTTTLHTLAGLNAPRSGQVLLGGRPLSSWPRRARACRLGLLPQVSEDPFPATVLESALIGRHPYVGFWQWEGERDLGVVRAALAECDLKGAEARAVATLSGGERRRLALATVLAQDPGVLLLDEPLNHLDPHHQQDVLDGLRRRADSGTAVLATLHDATLAARYADRVLLLYGDGGWESGSACDTLTAVRLSRLFRIAMREHALDGRRVFLAG
jgi:iron complex transport system ATP-binding protein